MSRKKPAETAQRSLVKSIVFRMLVITSDTMVIFLLTHRIDQTVEVAVATNLAAMTLYYLYERVWSRIGWGRT